ncbi:MAG: exonuclease domain-containing protein [Chitinophagaceae bacterium]
MYAIVDIETTGGYAAGNGIIEISIQVYDGETIIEQFETLINPGQVIPKYIQAFTGIDNNMVEGSPYFEEVAEKIFTILAGNIFVAHNVNFDYSFVRNHLAQYGYTLNTKKLCTVRLARQIFPGLPSYSLGNLCHSLGIPINNRHRAGGDALATVNLFNRMLLNDRNQCIQTSLKKISKEQTLPPHVPKEHFMQLPATPGVYYFHDNKEKVVYVGKAKNIKSRVNSHFCNNADTRQKQNFLRSVYSISFQSTGTELMAAILESTEIKRLWPAFNTAQKSPEEVFGIFVYEDQNGYLRLAIEKRRKCSNPVYTFHYKVDGHALLRTLMKDFSLCPKLCFMQTGADPCQGVIDNHCHGACNKEEPPELYNARIREAVNSLSERPSYIVLDKGMNSEEVSCIMVVRGSFFGMGYLPAGFTATEESAITPYIQPYKENSYIRSMLHAHFTNFPHQIKTLST